MKKIHSAILGQTFSVPLFCLYSNFTPSLNTCPYAPFFLRLSSFSVHLQRFILYCVLFRNFVLFALTIAFGFFQETHLQKNPFSLVSKFCSKSKSSRFLASNLKNPFQNFGGQASFHAFSNFSCLFQIYKQSFVAI